MKELIIFSTSESFGNKITRFDTGETSESKKREKGYSNKIWSIPF